MKARTLLAIASLTCMALVSTAKAYVIISPVDATASSTWSADYDILNTIDRSGLFTPFVSGVTDFDAYLLTHPLHTAVAIDNEWFTAEFDTSAQVTYDLGSVIDINRLALWNEESAGFGTARISVSDDGLAFTFAANIDPPDSPAGQDYVGWVYGLGAITTRYVRFDISGCPQPDGSTLQTCGIGEVAFSAVAQVPEPTTLALLAVALAGLGFVRRQPVT